MAERGRSTSIDILKAVCAFLIVCIHVPFPGTVGVYFTTLTRAAVPIFFMITGYFYSDTTAHNNKKQQMCKMFRLTLESNLLFLFCKLMLKILEDGNITSYISGFFTPKIILKAIFLNESPFAGHLWYLNAILYTLIIVYWVDKFTCRKVLYFLAPFLLACDLVFGKYSLLIWHREFPYTLVRNYLFVGIPYFCIGAIIRENEYAKKWNKKALQVLILVFAITSFLERFVLVYTGLNATRDHYISTTFLAICLFTYALKSNWCNETLAVIGRKYSSWIYIVHPIFITTFAMITGKLGVNSIYSYIAPIIIYCTTLVFLFVVQNFKLLVTKKQ